MAQHVALLDNVCDRELHETRLQVAFANSLYPDQARRAFLSGSTLFAKMLSKIFQHMTEADNFCYDWHFKG